MTCREFIDFLLDYTSGELSEAERVAFDRHLAGCRSCAAYLGSYQDTIRLGRAACAHPDDPVPETVPDDLVRAILAAIQPSA